jgi:alcohol dehydrogenase
MAYAEFMAGIAFNSTSLGFVHALSHSLSARFNTPHGLANAILLIYILDYELEVPIVQVKLKQIVNYIDLKPADFSAAECIKRIMTLLKTINIPLTLKDIHPELSAKDIKIMAKTAMKDFTGISNPIQFSNRQIKQIYRNAYAGKLIHSNITLTN